MKNLLLAAVASVALIASAPADAADLGARPAYKTPPLVPPAPVPIWTGCYVGGDVAAVWAHKNYTDPQFGGQHVTSHKASGAAVGGQLGCDYQAGNWVLGAQAMLDWTHAMGASPYAPNPKFIEHTLISGMATLTGRIGYAVRPAVLLYVRGGATWIRDKHWETYNLNPIFYGDAHVTRSGWIVGGGLEYMFHPGWSAFVEYDFMDLGTRDVTLRYTPATVNLGFASSYVYDIRQNVQAVLIGLNYRFGWGKAPVVAKY